MTARVSVFGSINTDLVVYVDRLPDPGETVSGGTVASYPGGKGANQAVAAVRAGASVEMHGCLGEDSFGRERIASLQETGVSTAGVRLLPGVASGIAQIAVDRDGENTIAVAPGANTRFSADGISLAKVLSGETWVALFQNEVPQEATEELVARAHAAGWAVVWNLAPTLARRPSAESLRAADFLICNRKELAALAGNAAAADDSDVSALEAEARQVIGWGVRNLVVTLGRRGSAWISASGTLRIPAFAVEAVDTVGAGDCYCGVFAASMAEGKQAAEALRRASAAAALSTTRRGAQPSMPSREETEGFLSSRGE
jgi:ribokinase